MAPPWAILIRTFGAEESQKIIIGRKNDQGQKMIFQHEQMMVKGHYILNF